MKPHKTYKSSLTPWHGDKLAFLQACRTQNYYRKGMWKLERMSVRNIK